MPARQHQLDELAPFARCRVCGLDKRTVTDGVWSWGCPVGPDERTQPIDVRVDGAQPKTVARHG